MKQKVLFIFTIALWCIVVMDRGWFLPALSAGQGQEITYPKENNRASIGDAMILLKSRRDNDAFIIFKKVQVEEPDNLDALWGMAEVLRRSRNYKDSEVILNEILKRNPRHGPSLISLSYIRYKEDNLNIALKLIRKVLGDKGMDRESRALAYMMLGSVNSRRSAKGKFFSKIKYGTQIKGYFLKAKALAPQIPEVHMGLGAFYLLAPAIVGGNLDKAIGELELAVKIAPGFATANARLAQAYQKKGDLQKYNLYLRRARELDPENGVLGELKQ